MWSGMGGMEDSPTLVGGLPESALATPSSIWNPGPPQSQGGGGGWQLGGIPGRGGAGQGGFPPNGGQPYPGQQQPGGPRQKTPWDAPNGWSQTPPGAGAPPQQTAAGGGWGAPPPAPPPQPGGGWAVPPSQPWGGASGSSPGGSFAEVAKKGVPPPPPPSNQALPNQPNAGMRPGRGGYDSGVGGWGKHVDQGTPWDVAAGHEGGKPPMQQAHPPVQAPTQAPQWSRDGTAHWQQPQTQAPNQPDHTGTAGWGQQAQQQQQAPNPNSWGHPQAPPPGVQRPGDNQWGRNPGPGGASWNDMGSRGGQSAGGGGSFDPNPQTPSMWVPPGPQEQRDDMIWHDPNPKQKKIQMDKGTNVWGDPTGQGEIKRWKEPSEDPTAGAGGVQSQSAAAAAGGSSSTASSTTGGESLWERTPLAPQAPPASTNGGGQSSSSGSSNVQTPTTTTNSMLQSQQQMPTQPQTAGAPTAGGWGQQSAQTPQGQEAGRNGGGSDWGSNAATGWNTAPMKTQSSAPSTGAMAPLISTTNGAVPPNPGGGASDQQQKNAMDVLTQQIADQLRIAVSKGLINISILNQPLPQKTLVMLNQLLQRVSKVEAARGEEERIRLQQPGGNYTDEQKQKLHQLASSIQQLQQEIKTLQDSINSSTGGANDGSTTAPATPVNGEPLGGSKLSQWKQPSSLSADSADKSINASASAPNLEELKLEESIRHLTLDVVGSGDPWKSGKLNPGEADWSPPKAQNGFANVVGEGPNADDGASGDNARASAVEESVREFIPGKKWEWRDPQLAAEDPNATPGSLRQSALNASLANYMNNQQSLPSNIGGGNSTGGNQTSLYSSAFGMGGLGGDQLGPHGVNKMGGDPRFAFGLSPQQQQAVNNDPWGMRGGAGSRGPPSTMSQPFAPHGPHGGPPPARLANYNRSISSPANQQQSAFAPYGNAGGGYWILVQNLPMGRDEGLRAFCANMGRVVGFIAPQGTGFAAIKFQESPMDLEKILNRLQQQIANYGMTATIGKDSDVESFLQSVSNGQGGGGGRASTGGGSGPLMGGPPRGGGGGNSGGWPSNDLTGTAAAGWGMPPHGHPHHPPPGGPPGPPPFPPPIDFAPPPMHDFHGGYEPNPF